MVRLAVFFFVVLCVNSSAALFFSRSSIVASAQGRAINETCLSLAEQGSCEFYSCFESRLPCGREWYILKTGQYYCNKLQRHRSGFSDKGKQFLDDAQRCLTRSLKDMYEREYLDCHELEHHAVDAISPCYVESGFCDIFKSDAGQFSKVYEFRDLFTNGAGKIWREIADLATKCGKVALRNFTEKQGNLIDSFVGKFGK